MRTASARRLLLDRDAGENVYGGLAVALPFIHTRPRYFAEVIAELLFWVGPDKLLFGSDYAHLDAALAGRETLGLRAPRGHRQGTWRPLTDEIKEKILGLNAARLYNIDIAQKKAALAQTPIALAAE